MIDKNDLIDFMQAIEERTGCKLYVAGGYLRDGENGVRPKDVDIMVTIPPDANVSDARDFSESITRGAGFGFAPRHTLIEACWYMEDMISRGVVGLISGTIYHDDQVSPAQFIVYDQDFDQEHITADMDINICQITMDSSGTIIRTAAYKNGFRNAEVLVLHDYSNRRKVNRLKRMIEKYPNFNAPQLSTLQD